MRRRLRRGGRRVAARLLHLRQPHRGGADAGAALDGLAQLPDVFAAYNHYSGPKEIKVWRYNNHEGGGAHQIVEQVRFLQETL